MFSREKSHSCLSNSSDTASLCESTISYKSSLFSTKQQSKTAKSNVTRSSINTTTTTTNKSRHSLSTKNNNGTEDVVKKIEGLVAKNNQLEEENRVLRCLINEESGKVNYDERRILMLKCQIYQLEKQVNILSKSISFRRQSLIEANSVLGYLTDSFKAISFNDETKNTNSSMVFYNIPKDELKKWNEMCESVKIRLYKAEINIKEDDYAEPTLFDSEFCNERVDYLQICSGNLKHLNINKIGQLETELSQFYKKLIRLKESLQTSQKHMHYTNIKKNTTNFLPLHREGSKMIIDDCIQSCTNCIAKLFDLSLLVPSAPSKSIKANAINSFSEEKFLNRLKSFELPKQKREMVEMLVQSYIIASNYHRNMKNIENLAINEEIKFYRSCYALQKDYIESVINGFKCTYERFMNNLSENLKNPLTELISKFWKMKNESSEANLREFLQYFKETTCKFKTILEIFDQFPQNDAITETFNQVVLQLDNEITNLNKDFLKKASSFQEELIETNELIEQSEQVLTELVDDTQNLSLSTTLSTNQADIDY